MDDKAAKGNKKPKADAKSKITLKSKATIKKETKSDSEFRQLFNSINLSMALHRMVYESAGKAVDYIIDDVNPVYEKRTGFAKKQVVGKSPTDLYHVDEAPNLELFAKVAATGKAISFETFFPDMRIYAQVFAFSTKPGTFTTIISDITEHKNKEEALNESEERYRALVDMAPDAILVHRDGNIYYANASAVRTIRGGFIRELAKHNLLDLIAAEDRENARASVKTVEEGTTTLMTERRALRLDGQQWVLQAAGSPVRWNNETCVQVIIRDVTDRKKAEEQLRQRAEELKTVMDLAPAAIWVAHDPECHNITGNRMANEFYEAKEGENVSAGPASASPFRPAGFSATAGN